MSEDMPKVWWSPSEGQWLTPDRDGSDGFDMMPSEAFTLDLPDDAVELGPVSGEQVDARALELSYWFGRLQYTDDLPRLRGLMRARIEELEQQGDAIAYAAVSAAPAAPEEGTMCASCSHRAGTHLDGVGDCAGGSLYSKCRCNGFEAPTVSEETEWAVLMESEEDGNGYVVASEFSARILAAREQAHGLFRRTVTRSEWQEVTDDV